MTRLVEAKGRADYSPRAMTTTMTCTIWLGLLTGAVFAAPAMAQTEMYPGQGITVNPAAVNGGFYAAPYARNPYTEVIHLHLPKPAVHHHHVAAKPAASVATAASADTTPPPAPASPPPATSAGYPPPLDTLSDASAPPPAPAPVKKHKHHAAEASAPAPAPPPAQSGSGDDAALPLTLDPQADHPVAAPPKHKRADAAKTQKTADTDTSAASTIVSAPVSDAKSGLTRRSQVLFARGDPDISSATVDKMRGVAADLTTLLGAGAQRVQLDAYGGAPGDKGSDARRLSLKRALGIRELLIEDGVPSEKIDVRALGGIDDGGAPDRVDVLVRGG